MQRAQFLTAKTSSRKTPFQRMIDPMKQISTKTAIAWILAVSASAFIFLVWLIYIKQKPTTYPESVAILPLINCILNTASTVCLIAGLIAIKKREIKTHLSFMISAFICSTLFLITYIIYHSLHGDSHFLGQGIIRPIYFFVLISHILLTIAGLPLILTTFFFALTQNFTWHKKIARITYPIWLYISVSGILIYILLKSV